MPSTQGIEIVNNDYHNKGQKMYQLTIKENGKIVNDTKVDFTTAVNLTTFKTIYNLKKSLTIKKDNKSLTIKKV
jgi:Ni,Fe-hydrogenase III large subunit